MTTALILAALCLSAIPDAAQEAEALGLRVAPGFRVSVYSDETVADDIYAMTLDSQGRVVVTSGGYVSRLLDTDGDGRADKAEVLLKTPTGGMGLAFDGDDLWFCGEGWLSRYKGIPGTDRLDPKPERLVPLRFGEHGGHAMRKGPDGSWYVVAGNDAGVNRAMASTANSPVKAPEAGAILRLNPEGREVEIFAHGFRNPYDFDFNPSGDLFTYDSDCERDIFLPWYYPTRLYHVARGGHHGWRIPGYLRSWPRPEDSPDTVGMLARIGRGSPTGVACYRHSLFPERYRGGVFFLDWTFGRVHFTPITREGTSYRSTSEVFIEPIGTHGFAPTDVVVAPDGSLLVSIGGRKTRGAIYRITPEDGKPRDTKQELSDLDAVLVAPQPLDAWSRSSWLPVARRLGAEPFAKAMAEEGRTDSERIRAVEVLTEVFGGIPDGLIGIGAASRSAAVRARVAWSVGRSKSDVAVLKTLAADPEPRVRLAALDAVAERGAAESFVDVITSQLGADDLRIRQVAARLVAGLPERAWGELWSSRLRRDKQSRLSLAMAATWRGEDVNEIVAIALAVLEATEDPRLRFQAIRLVILALGDYRLNDPPVEVFTAYSLAGSLAGKEALVARILSSVHSHFPTGDERTDEEAARLLAMLEDEEASLPEKVAAFWTKESTATRDLHFLIVLARLRGPRPPELSGRVADTLLGLDAKLGGQEQRTKQVWNERLTETVAALVKRQPSLADDLLTRPGFIHPAHVPWASSFDSDRRLKAARLFFERAKADADFEVTPALIGLLPLLPPAEVRPVLRSRWEEIALRDNILPLLAEHPEEADRARFLAGLESAQPRVVSLGLKALDRLPADPDPAHLVPVLRLLNRLLSEGKEGTALRAEARRTAVRQLGESIEVRESATDLPTLRDVYRPVFDAFARKHPASVAALTGDDEDVSAWKATLGMVSWESGDASRGEAIFREKSCHACHAGSSRIGPDLTGAASRFSRDDLLAAIVAPNRDVAPPYRISTIETKDGRVISGIVAFESADGLIVQAGTTGTVRVATPDIAVRVAGQRSLMPTGLLKGLAPGQVADLYRYLQTLTPDRR